MLLRWMPLLAVLLLSANPILSFAEEKTSDFLKANYTYTDASAQPTAESVNFLMIGKGKKSSSLVSTGKKIEPPSSCIVSAKSFVNCRR